MNTTKNPYHIDVTEEEDAMFKDPIVSEQEEKRPSISFKTAFAIVLVVHVVGAVLLFSSSSKANAKEIGLVSSNSTQAEPKPDSDPTPEPTPVATPTESQPSQPTAATNKVVSQKRLVEEYVVKPGDSFTSIVKKYKLNSQRLMKLNNISDPNKIQIGQKLKFM